MSVKPGAAGGPVFMRLPASCAMALLRIPDHFQGLAWLRRDAVRLAFDAV
jgi:hypothetical protein